MSKSTLKDPNNMYQLQLGTLRLPDAHAQTAATSVCRLLYHANIPNVALWLKDM